MNGPVRLKQGSGFSKKLLDSAAFDEPSAAARRRAVLYASTAGGLSRTHRDDAGRISGERRTSSDLLKTLVTWIAIGAAASAALAFGASRLTGAAHTDGGLKAAAELPSLPQARPSDISPELNAAPTLAPSPPAPPQAAAPSAAASALPPPSASPASSAAPASVKAKPLKPLAAPTSSAQP